MCRSTVEEPPRRGEDSYCGSTSICRVPLGLGKWGELALGAGGATTGWVGMAQAQFFDNKFTGLAVPILFLVQAKNLNANLTQLMLTVVAKGMALLDANAEAWAQKVRASSHSFIATGRWFRLLICF